MLIALGCVTVVALAILILAYTGQRAHQDAQAQWAVERRELLNRIQRPDYLPAAVSEHYEVPEQEPDDWNLVGTIAYPDPGETSEDE